jgi:hypothetical protein
MAAASAPSPFPVLGGMATGGQVAASVTGAPVMGAAPLTSTDPGNAIKKDSLGPVIAVVAVVAVVAGGAFWWYRSTQPAAKDAAARVVASAEAPATAPSPVAVAAPAPAAPSTVVAVASVSAAPVEVRPAESAAEAKPAVAVAVPPVRQSVGAVPASRVPVARPLPVPVAAPPPPPGPKKSVLDERN